MTKKSIIYKDVDISDIDVKYRTIFRRIFYKLDEPHPKTLTIDLNVENESDLNFFNKLMEVVAHFSDNFNVFVDRKSTETSHCVKQTYITTFDDELTTKVDLLFDFNLNAINNQIYVLMASYFLVDEINFYILDEALDDIFDQKPITMLVYIYDEKTDSKNFQESYPNIFYDKTYSKVFIRLKKKRN